MKKFSKLFVVFALLFTVGSLNVKASEVSVSNASELKNCVKVNGNTCKLTNNISLTETVWFNTGGSVIIDLNGYNIDYAGATNPSALFGMIGTKVTFTGKGTIDATAFEDCSGIIMYGYKQSVKDYTVLTIDKDVTVKTDNHYVIWVVNNGTPSNGGYYSAYGTVVNISGKLYGENSGVLYINGNIQDTEGYVPTFNINDGAVLESPNGIGIYAAGYAKWNFGKATVKGAESGVGLKAGKFVFNETNVQGTGENNPSPDKWGNGINPSGAALQVETNAGYADNIEIEINGGTYESKKGHSFLEYVGESTVVDMKITDGKFKSASGLDVFNVTNNFNIEKFISGGTYSSKILKKYIADEYTLFADSDKYVVAKDGDYELDFPLFIRVGQSVNLDYTATGGYKDYLTFKSSDNSVATIKDNKITGVKEGTTEITTSGNAYDEKNDNLELVVYQVDALDEVTDENSKVIDEWIQKQVNSKLGDETTELISEILQDNPQTKVEIKDLAKKDVDSEELKEIESALEDGYTAIEYYDISVLLQNGDGTKSVKVEQLDNKFKITLPAPTNLPKLKDGYKRQFVIVRMHDGKAKLIDATVNEDGTLSFETDAFSTYAVAYNDVKTSGTTENATNPQTSDSIMIFAGLLLISIGGIGLTKFSLSK